MAKIVAQQRLDAGYGRLTADGTNNARTLFRLREEPAAQALTFFLCDAVDPARDARFRVVLDCSQDGVVQDGKPSSVRTNTTHASIVRSARHHTGLTIHRANFGFKHFVSDDCSAREPVAADRITYRLDPTLTIEH